MPVPVLHVHRLDCCRWTHKSYLFQKMTETLPESFRSHLYIRLLIAFCCAIQLLSLLLSPSFVVQYYPSPTLQQEQEQDNLYPVGRENPEEGPGLSLSFQAPSLSAHQKNDTNEGRQEFQNRTMTWFTEAGDLNQNRCALCFFGLPRSFKAMILPSIVKNVLIPNARHNCDVYMHFYDIYEESSGRLNLGGKLDPRQVYLLEKAVQDVQDHHWHHDDGTVFSGIRSHRAPIVAIINDTAAEFWKKRGAILAKYQNTTHLKTGKPLYFPWRASTYQKSSVDNIVRQWHSIESVFGLMETTGQHLQVKYSRVGMFRSDVMYMTPIDIALMDRGLIDSHNRHVVVPGFGSWPVSDRMIYGNFNGVKIWSTRRFSLIEKRVSSSRNAGYVMHSELFLNSTIFPAIVVSGIKINTNWDVCFLRTRSDMTALISDCSLGGNSRGWDKVDVRSHVESIIQKKCSPPFSTDTQMNNIPSPYVFVACGELIF